MKRRQSWKPRHCVQPLLAEEMKLSVIQVLQWLTDISATRGQNGMDDALDKATQYSRTEKKLPHLLINNRGRGCFVLDPMILSGLCACHLLRSRRGFSFSGAQAMETTAPMTKTAVRACPKTPRESPKNHTYQVPFGKIR